MLLGSSTTGSTCLCGEKTHSAVAIVNPDVVSRCTAISAYIKYEAAWDGNITQLVTSSGVPYTSVLSSGTVVNPDKVISGNLTHYTPEEDLDNNWAALVNGAAITLLFSKLTTFNELVVLLHPHNTPGGFTFEASVNGVSWTTLWSPDNPKFKNVVKFNSDLSYKFLKITSKADLLWVCQIAVYRWVDESDYLLKGEDGAPDIQVSSKFDFSQNSSPTASECVANFDNITRRYVSTNASSPIYGIAQPDGKGSGIKSNVPIRVTSTMTGLVSGVEQTWTGVYYYGYIYNDDSPAGSQGVTIDASEKTAMIVAKSIYTCLDKNINYPAYNGASLDYIAKDAAVRCGVPEQDIVCSGMEQTQSWLALGQGSPSDLITDISAALPYFRAFETYSIMGASLQMVNAGKVRMDVDFSSYIVVSEGVGDRPDGYWQWMISKEDKKMYVFQVSYDNPLEDNVMISLMSWDMTKSVTEGFSQLGDLVIDHLIAHSPGSPQMAMIRLGNYFYIVNVKDLKRPNGTVVYTSVREVKVGDNLSALSAPTYIDFAGYNAYSKIYGLSGYDKYIFISMYGRSSNGTIPDITYYNSLYVHNVETGATRTLLNTFTDQGGLGTDGKYLVQMTSSGIRVWYYNQAPETAVFSWQTYVDTGISGVCFVNERIYFWIGRAFYYVSASDVWANGAAAVRYSVGILSTSTGATGSGVQTCYKDGFFYFYVGDSSGVQLFIWNTSASFTTAFNLGLFSQDNLISPLSIDANPLEQTFDFWNAAWQRNTLYDAGLTGFLVAGQDQKKPVAQYEFEWGDGFVDNMVLAIGNPVANRVQVKANYQSLATSMSAVFTQPDDLPYVVEGNKKNVFAMSLSVSDRGQGYSPTTHRYAVASGTTIYDDPSLQTNVVIDAITYPCTFYGLSDIGYLIIDATGLSGSTLDGVVVYGRTVASSETGTIITDRSDAVSKKMYNGVEYLQMIDSPIFIDTSLVADILLNGKYARLYLTEMPMPWYPSVRVGDIIGITNSDWSLSGELFQVLEYTHDGYSTTIKAKRANFFYNIGTPTSAGRYMYFRSGLIVKTRGDQNLLLRGSNV